MSKVIQLRHKLQSFYKINKATEAMQVVAVAELKRLQSRQKAAGHFKKHYDRLARRLKVKSDRKTVKVKPVSRVFLLGSDRGFCGSFNERLLALLKPLSKSGNELNFIIIGNKLGQVCKEAGLKNFEQKTALQYQDIEKLARETYALWQAGEVSDVYIIYNEFKSMLMQSPRSVRVLPFAFKDSLLTDETVIVEPNYTLVHRSIRVNYIKAVFYDAFLQSKLGEVASRLLTMRGATENSREMIGNLKIQLNKARQAMITVELSEILSSFEILSEGEG